MVPPFSGYADVTVSDMCSHTRASESHTTHPESEAITIFSISDRWHHGPQISMGLVVTPSCFTVGLRSILNPLLLT